MERFGPGLLVVSSLSEVLGQRDLPYVGWIGALAGILDENARTGHWMPSGLVLAHRFLMPNQTGFEHHVLFLVSFLTASLQGRLVGDELAGWCIRDNKGLSL